MQLKDLQLKRALHTALLVLLLNAVGMTKGYAQNLIVNGDFENGNSGFLTDYTYVVPQYNGQNVGIENGKYTIDNTSSGHGIGYVGWPTVLGYGGSGKYMLVNGFGGTTNPTKVVWKQTVTVTPNTDYIFLCQVVNLAQSIFGYSPNPAILRLKINGTTIGSDYQLAQNNNWHEWSVSWSNGNATQVEIAIYDVYTGDSGLADDFGLDDISFMAPYSNNITFADPNVKAICVAIWDTNGDGELNYDEASAVTNLGQVFSYNTTITSFNELQYFTGLSSIGDQAFCNSTGLTSIKIPNSVTSIGNYAFSGCSGFTGSLTIPNSVTTIGNSSFSGCSGLTGSLTIPNSVTIIGNNAFSGCSGLTGSLTIPNSVTTIGNYAFYFCSGLTDNLIIPNSVITISDGAFMGCRNFTSIISLAETPPILGISAFGACGLYGVNTPVYVPCGFGEAYSSLTWGDFSSFYGLCGGVVTVAADPEEGGIVTGGGIIEAGQTCTVTASANEGYVFVNWTKNGMIASTNAEYTFYAAGDMTLVAHFVPAEGNIDFADANVKSICVSHWDSNGDGELNYEEAASVTSLNNYFQGNMQITSFEELQYFIGLTSIGDDEFLNCSNLMGNLFIPNSVTTIGRAAFAGRSGLTGNLVIPNSVTSIGDDAFQNCSGFTGDLIIPNTVTTIGFGAFRNCSGFTGSLTIGNFVTTIGGWAFFGCNGFTDSLTIPNSVTSIGQYAFSGCSGFTGSLTIGNSVITIGNYAFDGCSGLTGSLTIPNSVTSIGNSAFYNCSGFTGSLTIGDSVTTIGDRAFQYCSSFTGSLTIPNSVTSIGNYAFHNCGGLTDSLTIGNSVTSIGDWAFYNCSGFTGSLTIGDSVTSIGNSAFYNCSGFTGSLTIGNSVTTIGNSAFYNCSGLMGSLTIGDSVTTIGDCAFQYCSGFTGSLTIPSTVTTIGYCAFAGCSSLMGSLTIGNSVTTIGRSAFYRCSGLTGNLTIPNSVTTIGNYAFYNCSGFSGSLTIPNSVTSLEYGAFSGCSGLTGSLTIPSALTTIEDMVFSGCSGLTGSLTIPDAVSFIGNSAFSGCSGLTGSLTIPNLVTSIGSGSFANCSGLTEINIPNSVTMIGDYAFLNCSGLTGSLVIPNSVTTIGDDAFANCIGLISLDLGNSVTTIGYAAFTGCSGFMGSLTIPDSVTFLGSWAFSDCSGLTEIMMLGTTPPSIGHYRTFYNTNDCPIYVPYESLNDYKTATNWSDYEDRIFPMTYETISGYGEGEGNWRFIASPLVENTDPTTVNNMITETAYDLYEFNQSATDGEWQNYKANTEDFVLENGQGYLYANAEDVNIIFKGNFNEDETKEVGLVFDANATFAGWNLLGNPFPVSAYANKSYYTMNEDGTGIEPVAVSSAMAIAPCTGVMVVAEGTEESVTFSKTAPEMAANQGNVQVAVAENTLSRDGIATVSKPLWDKAIVSFNMGDQLEKFIFNKGSASLSIPQGVKDFAIACSEKQGEMPLDFKAAKNGSYTLSVNAENAELEYLHLIDNLTGADVDLLATPNYTFDAKTSDYASRFRLVFNANETDGPSTDSGTFAFISNGNIIVTGVEADAVLQIVDEMGRVLVSYKGDAMNRVSTGGMTPGVYVLRLIQGENMKTQKIVVW